jgi:hypothetical protein
MLSFLENQVFEAKILRIAEEKITLAFLEA